MVDVLHRVAARATPDRVVSTLTTAAGVAGRPRPHDLTIDDWG